MKNNKSASSKLERTEWTCNGFLGYRSKPKGKVIRMKGVEKKVHGFHVSVHGVLTKSSPGVLEIYIPPAVRGQRRARKHALKLVDFLTNHPKNAK